MSRTRFRRYSQLAIIVATAALILYDLVVYFSDGVTLSMAMWDWSKDYPAVPFCFGVLMGHFFFPAE